MNKTFKKFLICVLSVLMLVTAFTMTVAADDTNAVAVDAVAKVGNTEYATIDEAIANWTNNTTLTLLADVTLSKTIELSSTEYHVLDLGTYTMTAASKKDAIQIVNNGRTSASYALDIKADATNPGGITASGKAVVKTTGKSGVKDRPIIRFYGGVFTGSNVVYHSGSNGTNCPQFWFYGGEFNGTVFANRALFQFYGGTFNGNLQISVDSSAYALISGGRFQKLSNLYGSSLNNDKFTIGSAKGTYDRSIYVDAEGYYVITSEVITEVSAKYPAVKKESYNSNNYFRYSAAATYGMFYEVASMAGTGSNVTIWVKPAVTIPENVTGDIVDEIKNNTALKDYTPEKLPAGAELEIVLVSVGETFVYDVTPMANGAEVEPTEAITFRLPVPASVTKTFVKVYHDRELMGIYAIQGEGNAKYVEISSADFSEFAVEPVAAKIGETYYETIQAAINAAQNGNTVTILPGEYGTINISNKNITIQGTVGENGELLTTIKGGNPAITGHSFNGTIKDLKIVDAFKVMYAEPAGNVTVDNVYVTGATYGFHLVAYSTNLTWTIQNSYMDLSWANSFGVYGSGDAAIVIKDNEFASTSPYYPDYGALAVNTFLPNVTVEGNVFGENTKILVRPDVTDTSKINISKNYHADGVENAFVEDSVKVDIYEYYKNADLTELADTRIVQIGDTKYATLQAAINAAQAGNTIELLADIDATEVIMIGKSVTINGNGYTITSSATRVFRVTTSNVEVTLNDVNMVCTKASSYTADIRGISIDASLSNVTLTLNNCSVDFTDVSACDWSYAVNVSGNGTGHTVTVNAGSYEGANVINVHGANNTIVVKNARLTSLYSDDEVYYGACIWVLQNQGTSVTAEGNTFKGTNAVAFNVGTGTTVTESGNEDHTITEIVVAKTGYVLFNSLQAAINAVQNGETIVLLDDVTENVTLTEKVGLSYTIDGNGKKFNGTMTIKSLSDTNDNRRITIKNVNFVTETGRDFITSVETNHYPRLTVEGCSFTGTGKAAADTVAIRLKSSHSVIIKDCTGTGLHSFLQNTSGWNLTVENVTVTDSKSGLALGTVQGATIKGCNLDVDGYGIRIDANTYNNNAVIESNTVEAFIPVVVRKANANSNITFAGTNTMTATNDDGIWMAIGTSEYEANGTMPTAPEAKVYVTLNDNNLSKEGIYQEVIMLEGKGTEDEPYLITSVEELIFFRDSVNKGETTYNASGVYVALNANIDLAGIDWSVNIGDDCNATFDGIFDGKDHTISNLTSTETAQKGDGYICTGLFGAIYGNAQIKNLTIENVNINTGDFTGNNVAAVVGFAYNATGSIENVKVIGIKINAAKATGVGAIVGYDYYSPALTIKNCEVIGNNDSEITGKSYVGGIVGYASSKIAIANNTVNNIDVTATGSVGAIAGIMLGGGSATANTVKNVELTATGEHWKNTAAVVAGTITGGGVTVADTTTENVTANGVEATLVGGKLVEKPTSAIVGVQAVAGNVYYGTLQEALADTNNNETIKLLTPFTVGVGETVVLNLNGKTIEGVDTATGSFALITNKGNLTITGNGTIKLIATNNRGWNAYSSVISNTVGGKLVVENGTIEHLGGTDMAYAIDNLTNGKGTYAETVINGGTIKSTYRAIRQFLNGVEAQNILTINGGTIEGTNKSVWMQDPSKNANTGKLTITDGAVLNGDVYLYVTAGSTEWPVEVSIAASAVNGEILTGNVPAGYALLKANDIYGVVEAVAIIGEKAYSTLEEAFKAATEGCTIEILADVVIDYKWDCRDYATNGSHSQFKESVTINGNGHTIKFTGTISDGNWNTIFRFEENATVTNLTIDISEATGAQRVITAKKSLTVDGLTIVGNAKYGIIFGEGASAADLAATEIVIKNSTLTGTRRAISDNEGGQDVKSVSITDNKLNAKVYVSASTSVVFNNNTVDGVVDIRSYAGDDSVLDVEAQGNTLNAEADNKITAKTIDAQSEFTTKYPPVKVSTKAELNAALAAAQDGDIIILTADIDYGTDQLAISKAITLNLGGHTLTTRNAYGGMSIKNNPTIKNGTIVHASNTAAIKVWNATAFEDLVIDVQGKGDANKTIGGIVLQSGSTTRVGSIKNVTIKGAALTNGIETYNCGDATENVIGSMNNVTINAVGTGMLISAPCGTATNCSISGGVNGIEIWIKGNYSASLELADSTVEGGVYAHDEFNSNPGVVNNGTLNFTVDEATDVDDVTLTLARAENVEGKLKEIKDKAQAKVNDTYYATLADALAAAQADDTVTLLADVNGGITVNKKITLDGNGYNASGKLSIKATGATVKNLKVTTSGTACYVGAKDVTIDNCTLKGGNGLYQSYTSGKVTFKNSTITGGTYGIHFDGSTGGEIVIEGCVITGWTSFAATIKNVTVTDTTFAKGNYNFIRFYQQNVVIDGCTFNSEMAVDFAVNNANVTVTDCTVENGTVEDLFYGSDIVNSNITVDGVKLVRVAKIGDKYYATLTEAMKAAKAGDVVTVLEGTYAMPSMKAGITIEGIGKVMFEGTLSGTLENLTLKNIHIKGGNSQRWAYAKGALVFENVTFEATSVYALHFDGITEGATLLYKNCTIIGWAAMSGSPESCVFDSCTFKGNGTYGLIRTYFDATIENCAFDVANVNTNDNYQDGIHAVSGAIVTVNNCTNANGDMNAIVNVSGTSAVVLDGVTIQNVAKIGDKYYATLADAFAAAQNGDTITLLSDIAVDTETYTIAEGKKITLDMNSKNINVTDNASANYELFYIYGEMIVTGNGTIELTATNNRTWNAMSVIFHNRGGVLTIENGTFTHCGGTDMAYVVDNSGNYYGDATTNINGGTLTSTYTAIRNRMEQNTHGASGKAILNVTGGTINGTTSAIWAQAASTSTVAPATGEINISGGEIGIINTARSEGAVSMTTITGGTVAGFKGESGELTVNGGTIDEITILFADGTNPEKLIVKDNVYYGAIAKIGSKYYATLADAVAAAANRATITLLHSASGAGVVIDKPITIDFAGYTYTITSPVGSAGTESNGFQILNNNSGYKVTLKNGTLKVADSAHKEFYILVQNYTDLTINSMTLDGTNLDKYAFTDGDSYVLSNNSGNITINGTTNIITNNDGNKAIAFDVCEYGNYVAPVVTVTSSVKINDVSLANAGNKIESPAKIGSIYYATLEQAVKAATDKQTITLLSNASGSGIVIDADITINFNGFTYTITSGVGSKGTESNGFQILAGNTVTLNNGTITVADSAKNDIGILIQNYADLKLTNMKLSDKNLEKDNYPYVLSNNSGNVMINGTTEIKVTSENGVAFDVCKYGNYELPIVTVASTATINGKTEAAAKINNVYYATFEAAYAVAVANNKTISLANDLYLTKKDVVKTEDGLNVMFKFDKNVTFDLNGHTIYVDYDNNELLYAVVYVANGVTLTVKDSVGNGGIDVKTGDTLAGSYDCVAYMFWKRGTTGKLNINGGNYHANKLEDSMVYTNTNLGVTINGGSFILDNVGTGANQSPWIFNTQGRNERKIIVNGGTFNADVFHQYWIFEVTAAKELALQYNEEKGTYTVVEAVAYVNEQHFADKWYTKNVGYATVEEAEAVVHAEVQTAKVGTKVYTAEKEVVKEFN